MFENKKKNQTQVKPKKNLTDQKLFLLFHLHFDIHTKPDAAFNNNSIGYSI